MAKDKGKSRTDIDWILRDRKVIDGLDHLGIELVSVNLYQAMLPGITNVTERARYYAFYPWTMPNGMERFPHTGDWYLPDVRLRAADAIRREPHAPCWGRPCGNVHVTGGQACAKVSAKR